MYNARSSRYFEFWLGRDNYSVDGMRPFGAAFFWSWTWLLEIQVNRKTVACH